MSRLLANFCGKRCISVHNLLTTRCGKAANIRNRYICQLCLVHHDNPLIIAQNIHILAQKASPVWVTSPTYNQHIYQFSSAQPPTDDQSSSLTESEFEDMCHETLESLYDRFEALIDDDFTSTDYDVHLSSGVLTVKLGSGKGTYVINKQTPNRQIWLSSPFSGPKRYDYIDGRWIYKHDGRTLHELLSEEVSQAFKESIDFTQCMNSGDGEDS